MPAFTWVVDRERRRVHGRDARSSATSTSRRSTSTSRRLEALVTDADGRHPPRPPLRPCADIDADPRARAARTASGSSRTRLRARRLVRRPPRRHARRRRRFSFHPRKSITTGEGGMVTTADADLAALAPLAARPRRVAVGPRAPRGERRASCSPTTTTSASTTGMTDIQGALGCAQMDRARRTPRRAAASAPRGTTSCSPTSTGCSTPVDAGRATCTATRPTCCLFRARGADARQRRRAARPPQRADGRARAARHRDAPGHARAGAHGLLRAAATACGRAISRARVIADRLIARPARSIPTVDRRRAGRPSSRELDAAFARGLSMCGIAGVLRATRRRRRSTRIVLRPMTRGDRPSRPRRRGHVRRTGRSGSATGAWRSSTCRPRAHSRWPTRRATLVHHLQRRGLQLPRAARASSRRRGHRFRSHTDTEVVLHALRGVGRRRASSASTACSRSPIWDRRRGASCSSPATATASSRCTTPTVGPRVLVRLGDQGAARARRRAREAEPRRTCSSTSPSRTSSPTARSSTASSCCRPATTSTLRAERPAPRARALLGLRLRARPTAASRDDGVRARSSTGCSARPSSASSSRDVPVGALPQRRHGLRLDHRASPRDALPVPARRSPVGFDLTSASGMELGFDERRKAEAMSYLFNTEHYEMVLKAGDMERCLPALIWHLEDPRVGQCYPNYYVARLASKFVKVVLSGRGRRRAVRRLPVALLPRGRQRRLRPLRREVLRFWHRLLPNAMHAASSSRRIWSDVARLSARSTSSATCSPTTRRARVARGLRQPLALPRGQDVPARPAASSRTS